MTPDLELPNEVLKAVDLAASVPRPDRDTFLNLARIVYALGSEGTPEENARRARALVNSDTCPVCFCPTTKQWLRDHVACKRCLADRRGIVVRPAAVIAISDGVR